MMRTSMFILVAVYFTYASCAIPPEETIPLETTFVPPPPEETTYKYDIHEDAADYHTPLCEPRCSGSGSVDECGPDSTCTTVDCKTHDQCDSAYEPSCCPVRCAYIVEDVVPKNCMLSSDCPAGYSCIAYEFVEGKVCCPEEYINSVAFPLEPSEVIKSFGCSQPSDCRCFAETCNTYGLEYCQCEYCDSNKCCCTKKADSSKCSDGKCKCMGKRKSCLQRGLVYCDPESCGDNCPGYRCCCKASTTGLVSTGYHEKCADGKKCFCSKRKTCYQKKLAYCKCDSKLNCPEANCCCRRAKVKTCRRKAKDCKCSEAPCHTRGLSYCKSGSCEGCDPHLCCCNA